MYDQLDERGVPRSKGVPNAVRAAALVGLVAIFVIGGAVIWNSGYGHLWPADTVQRMPLNGK